MHFILICQFFIYIFDSFLSLGKYTENEMDNISGNRVTVQQFKHCILGRGDARLTASKHCKYKLLATWASGNCGVKQYCAVL